MGGYPKESKSQPKINQPPHLTPGLHNKPTASPWACKLPLLTHQHPDTMHDTREIPKQR